MLVLCCPFLRPSHVWNVTLYYFITFLSVIVFYCGISVLVLRYLVLWHHHSTHFFLSVSPVKPLQPCISPHFSECLVKLCSLDVSFQIVSIFLSGLLPSPFSYLPIYCPCIADFYSLWLWIGLSRDTLAVVIYGGLTSWNVIIALSED